MSKIRVILSTKGPLHLIKSAEFLVPLIDIVVIQAWIPNKYDKFLIKIASKIVGRDLTKSLKKRTPEILNGRNYGIAFPEFYMWFCRYFLRINAAISSAKLYGFLSRRYIKNADIFHVRSGSGLGGAIEKAKNKGMKVVVDHSLAHPAFMDVMLRNEFEKYKLPFELGMNSKFWQGVLDDCSRADCLLVNSDFVKNTMVEQGYEEKKIKVVYLGVREDFFSLKSNYDINEKTKILFTGSFGFRKGGEYLLMAMMELDRLNFKYEMIVVGNYLGAESLIEKYKSKNIRYVGHVLQDELKKYLEESDIYLFPSLAEGCASSGMEAMAAGLPVVVTAESGLPINDGENGVIVSAKDSDAIVDAIIALKKDKSLRERLGKSASQTIINNFTWENYALKVLDAYHELL